MESNEAFTDALGKIASELGREKFEKLKFLCRDFIPDGDREKISTPEDLFQELEQQRKIAPCDLEFLTDRLENVGRKDLAEYLKNFESVCPGSGNGACSELQAFKRDVKLIKRSRGREGSQEVTGNISSQACQKMVEDAERYNERGKVEFQKKNFEAALQQCTHALQCLPDDQHDYRVKYLYNRAACYVNLRKFKDGHADCDAALLLRPHATKARFRLAQCLEGEGNISEAFLEVTSLLESNPIDSALKKLETSLKEKVEEAKVKANGKRQEGIQSFRRSEYKEAIMKFSEGILRLPRLPTNNKEMKELHWYRAECHLRQGNLEGAQTDCEEAQRLVPDDLAVLFTWMQVLDKLNKYRDCCKIANQLIDGKFKVKEAEEIIQRLLPKIDVVETDSQTEKKKKKKRKTKGKKKTDQKGEEEALLDGAKLDGNSNSGMLSSVAGPSKPVEDDDNSIEDVLGEKPIDPGESKRAGYTCPDHNLQSSITNEARRSAAVEERDTIAGTTNLLSLPLDREYDDHTIAVDADGKPEETTSSETIPSGPSQEIQEHGSTLGSDGNDKLLGDVGVHKPLYSPMPDLDDTMFGDSSQGNTYPRRILFICDQWRSWYRSVCIVNRELCRSFAKFKDVQVACLVLDASDQDRIIATRAGISLIKACPRPGIPRLQLLSLHNNFPFEVDLVVGHGMVSGPAAACLAKTLKCGRLHIFHNLPDEDDNVDVRLTPQEKDLAEKELGLTAEFVAAVGPLLVDEWSMTLNREVFSVIPGMPEVSPRNSIPCPQCRCLILGNMRSSKRLGLDVAIDALLKCRKRDKSIRLIVQGTDRDTIDELQNDLSKRCCSSQVEVVVKQLDVSSEVIGVEIRGVSLVLMPSRSEGFGLVALNAISAGVPTLISVSSGLARLLQDHFDEQFLDLLCSVSDEEDCIDDWSDAIDSILDDREAAFNLASRLREQWNSKFTWDLTTSRFLRVFTVSGLFSLPSPSASMNFPLASQCSKFALTFVQDDVELLNRRRKHVLFLSPEDASECPFIQYFAHVPWIAVFDFDINSTKTGCLASCETFCERMGMKVCRMLPPSPGEERRKFPTVLSNGIPWVLTEGMLESKRNILESLDWLREFFSALGKTYPVPITFTVLWRSTEETRVLCKKLSKILTVVQVSPLYNQVKVVAASTGDSVDRQLQDIAEEWGTDIRTIGLEDICNALYQCVSSSPLVQENLDFVLPVAHQDDPQGVCYEVLPPSSRWIHAEMEVLYLSVGSTPMFEGDDAYHFYRGGLISWYALQMDYAVERGNWKSLKARIDELLRRAGTVSLKMPHQRGTGGTTSARKILFDYHEKYPCVLLKSVNHAEVAPAIKVLAAFCSLPVIILVDCKQVLSDEFDVDMLYNSLSNDRIPSLILEVVHHSKQSEKDSLLSSGKIEKTTPVRLADSLDRDEAQKFVNIYSSQRRDKSAELRYLLSHGQDQLQIPFYYALITFEDRFTGLEPFVRECLKDLGRKEEQILLFLAIAYHYGQNSLLANDFAELLQAPRREVISLESVLPDLPRELLLEEEGKWRPRHDLIAVEMLHQLLTLRGSDGSALVHRDNWKNQLADKAIDFFTYMSETVVSDVLLSRITDDKSHQYLSFSQLISDIPFEEDAIKLFEKAISDFPDNPFFKVHLGRYYSIQKRSAGFAMAIKYTDDGIACSHDYSRLPRGQFAQMKGVVYSREVNYLIEKNADIKTIIEMADEGVKNFRRAVSIAPDFVDGYIPEVRMMCKVFEYIDKKTGSFCDYVKSLDAHPFIIDAISNTSNTLECVPDSDAYAHWRMRLACLGRKQFTPRKEKETMNLLFDLRSSGRASRGSVNRQIVIMKMERCIKNNQPFGEIAVEMIELLNEALKFDSNWEQTMRLWVRLAPCIPVDMSEAESKVFEWCSKEKSVRSFLYKYIIACLHLLEGGTRTYTEIMKNTKDDLNSALKAISRPDVGRCRHPDRPVVWLGQQGRGMGHLVYVDENISEVKDVRTKRFIPAITSKKLRRLTGIIVQTGPKVGTIRVNGGLEVTFRADLCRIPLVSSAFTNRKVQFFLAFNFFGSDAYNVQLVAE